jgi:hypothetical protein
MSDKHGVRMVLFASDYDEAINFYCDRTGLFTLAVNFALNEVARNVVLRFNDPKVPFFLVVAIAAKSIETASANPPGETWPLLVLPVPDCMSTYHQLTARGVPFSDQPQQLPYGCQATIIDPFGNRICLSERY